MIATMRFGDKLEALIAKRKWSRTDLLGAANALGAKITDSTINNYFNNKTRPSMDVGLALARSLGVPYDYLADDSLDFEPTKDELSEGEKLVLQTFREEGLTPGQAIKRLVLPEVGVRPRA